MTIDIAHSCSFTGHRPERLAISEEKAISWLKEQIEIAVAEGYTDFLSGMQRGVDIWAAEAVLELKKSGKPVRLIAVSPFKGVEKSWDKSWIDRFYNIWNNADDKVIVSFKPGRAAFFERNHYLVDHASKLIGVYTGAPGGTKETIEYAKKKGLEVVVIDKKLIR